MPRRSWPSHPLLLPLMAATFLLVTTQACSAAPDGTLMTVVKQHLAKSDWKFTQVEGRNVLRLGCKGSDATWTCVAEVKEDRHFVGFYSILPMKAPSDKRLLAAEFLMRANYGLKLGNFEMDFSDGQVLYKTSVNVDGGALTTQMVDTLLTTNVMIVDRYLSGLAKVLAGKATPAEAVAEAEKKQ